MRIVLKNIFAYSLFFYFQLAWGDFEHYKNTLIGGRAATMGGAYSAISDDASGAFYNPAGLSWAPTDSISGSANLYTMNNATYTRAIGNRDWERDNEQLSPNYFGVLKKAKKFHFAFSYAATDNYKEDQDQTYEGITEVSNSISIYNLNLHTEELTYLVGPSVSYRHSKDVSTGFSLFYHQRHYQKRQYQHIEYVSGSDEYTYNNLIKKEKGIRGVLGTQVSLRDNISFSLVYKRTYLLTALNDTQVGQKSSTATGLSYISSTNKNRRKTPHEVTLGIAYFPSPYFILSMDIDYFNLTAPNKDDVFNLSIGAEYFLSTKRAFRFGLYTNHSSSIEPSSLTIAPVEHIDMYGMALGYSIYSPKSSITMGLLVSRGEGEVQIFDSSSTVTALERMSYSMVLSSSFFI
jgi:long-chain fatty acid transport protein